MKPSITRTAATAIAIPIIFFVSWFICQWLWWGLGYVYDVLSPLIAPQGYDPKNIGFLQQLFRDLVPAGAAMAIAAWGASNFFQGVKTGYRLGAGIVLAALVFVACFTTYMMIDGNPILTWRDLTLSWATTGFVALVARWAYSNI